MLLTRHLCSRVKSLSRKLQGSWLHSTSAANEIVEGSAKMLHTDEDPVFYNNIQGINRDLSIQVINLFSKTLETERKERLMARHEDGSSQKTVSDNPATEASTRDGIFVLEALAATGLRSARYMQEIPTIRTLVINDLSAEATKTAHNTLAYNNIDLERIIIQNKDANDLMHEHKSQNNHFDVIDLDPYGSSAPFLDAAVQAVAGDGGLLCITCTDYATLCGVHPATSMGRYGTLNFPTSCKAEVALRTLLHAVDSAANRHERYIVPWVSLSIDYYVRVFVRVYKSKLEVKNSLLRRLMLYQAVDCPSFYTHALGKVRNQTKKDPVPQVNPLALPAVCEQTGGQWKLGGPFWGGPLHSQAVVDELLERVNYASRYSTPPQEFPAGTSTLMPETPAGSDDNLESPSEGDHIDSTSVLHPTPARVVHPIPTVKRLTGILTSMSEELKDVPFYYTLPDLSSALQCSTPKFSLVEAAITNAGYQVSNFHHEPNAIKTNAPDCLVWDIMRTICQSSTPSPMKKLSSTASKIRAVPCTFRPDFTIKEKSTTGYSEQKVVRFPKNEPHWGPRPRARPAGKAKNVQDE